MCRHDAHGRGRLAFAGALLGLLLWAPGSAGAATRFSVSMDESQVVGSDSTSPGFAVGSFTLTQDGANHLSFELSFDGTFDFTALGGGGAGGSETVAGLHFHDAPSGQIGSIEFGVTGPDNDLDGDTGFGPAGNGTLVTGEWDSGEGFLGGADLDDHVADLLAATPGEEVDLYLQLHTDIAGGRSIRGQLVAEPEAPVIDPDASEVQLRKSCVSHGGFLDDCFETSASLTSWLWGGGRTNPPSAQDPVLVRVGAGDFDPLICNGSQGELDGWVSFQGAGRENTRFVQVEEPVAAIDITNCTALEFSDLTAYGISDEVARGVYVKGYGTATWSDVDTYAEGTDPEAAILAWYDLSANQPDDLVQYLFGCRVEARGRAKTAYAYETGGADVWFYGGEITLRPTAEPGAPLPAAPSWTALWAIGGGRFHLFGTAVRGVAEEAPGFDGSLWGANVLGESLHMHGGIISLDGSGSGADVDVLGVLSNFGGLVHTPETAFALKPGGSGTAMRLSGSPSGFQSPFQWPAGASPPDIVSIHGADLFVDTAAGASGQEAHLMVYDTTCTGAGGPWRDMAAGGACR